jgi:hypothetical protein
VNDDELKPKPKFQMKDLLNFKGGIFKCATRSIPPAATMAVINILNPMLIESRPKRKELKNTVHSFFSPSSGATASLSTKDKSAAPEKHSTLGMKKSNGE